MPFLGKRSADDRFGRTAWGFPLALGEQMEKAFIWEQLDYATAAEEDVAAWWKTSVTFPEDFTYEKS